VRTFNKSMNLSTTGSLWELYAHIIEGRILRKPDGTQGVVCCFKYHDYSMKFAAMYQVRVPPFGAHTHTHTHTHTHRHTQTHTHTHTHTHTQTHMLRCGGTTAALPWMCLQRKWKSGAQTCSQTKRGSPKRSVLHSW